MERARRNGTRLEGLVWYGSKNNFAVAYMDTSSGAVSEPWAGMPEEGLPRFPLGSAACGRVDGFAWDSASGNLHIHHDLIELPPALASRLRHIEFLVAVDESPESAFREWVSQLQGRGHVDTQVTDDGLLLTWRSQERPLAIDLHVSQSYSSPSGGPRSRYSWILIATDPGRNLGTMTAADVQPIGGVGMRVPSDSAEIIETYQGMVRMGIGAGTTLFPETSAWSIAEVARKGFGVALFVTALCLLTARKDQP